MPMPLGMRMLLNSFGVEVDSEQVQNLITRLQTEGPDLIARVKHFDERLIRIETLLATLVKDLMYEEKDHEGELVRTGEASSGDDSNGPDSGMVRANGLPTLSNGPPWSSGKGEIS